MRLRGYQSTDYSDLCRWLKERALLPWEERYVPAIGYVVFDETPIVMGFLRMVEGGTCMIDGLCTNPIMSPSMRDRAIDVLVDALMSTAREMKLNGVICFSEDKNTLERSARFGFVTKPNHKLIVNTLEASL